MTLEPCLLDQEEASAWFAAHPHPNVLEPMAHADEKVYLGLRDGDRLVASATLQKRGAGFVQVGGIYVDDVQRRNGTGRKLIMEVAREARRMGGKRLVLGAYRREPDVSPFYRAVGFRSWIPFIPGTESRHIGGFTARLLARVFRVEAGPDAIRVMVRKA